MTIATSTLQYLATSTANSIINDVLDIFSVSFPYFLLFIAIIWILALFMKLIKLGSR